MILEGAAKRIEREKLFADANAWNGARLNAFAYHDPKHIPKFDAFFKRPAPSGPRGRPDWRVLQHRVMVFHAANGGEIIRR